MIRFFGSQDDRYPSGLTSILALAVILAAPIITDGYAGAATTEVAQTSFRKCKSGARINCVVDGDTIWFRGNKIRIADIDTPEISEPRCPSELALGNRATSRLIELINDGPFELHAWPGRDVDRYGRKLRVLVRDGRSLGDILVSEGLARTWSGRREPWC
jgi:micrococcal nuclease